MLAVVGVGRVGEVEDGRDVIGEGGIEKVVVGEVG